MSALQNASRTVVDRIRRSDDRSIGLGLIAIGILWIVASRVLSTLDLGFGTTLSLLASALDAFGLVHVVVGLAILVRAGPDRPGAVQFGEAIGIGVLALLAAGLLFVATEYVASGRFDPEVLVSLPFFVPYAAAWLFPIGMASTRRQLVLGLAGIGVVPIGLFLAVPLLILLGGGWLIAIAIVSAVSVVGLTLLTAIVGIPLLLAGRVVRDRSVTDCRR